MIFPGMDPYLEEPSHWVGVHNCLSVYISDVLQPRLLPRYVASIEERVYRDQITAPIVAPEYCRIDSRPDLPKRHDAALTIDAAIDIDVHDVDARETFVNILDRRDGERIVTVIEILSPSNKYAGVGRDEYQRKQREVRASQANLVEIDLLRAGPHVVAVPELSLSDRDPFDYLCCVNRAGQRTKYTCYFRTVRQRLPVVNIPLANGDADMPLDVQSLVAQTYESGAYRYRLQYDQPCRPLLSDADQAWADDLIRAADAHNSPAASS